MFATYYGTMHRDKNPKPVQKTGTMAVNGLEFHSKSIFLEVS